MTENSVHVSPTSRYLAPGWFVRHVLNPPMRALARHGRGPSDGRELRVVGRRSGEVRTTIVYEMAVDGETYLVAPRGTTEWVRNLRAAGTGELRRGKRVERFTPRELADGEKAAVLRAYVARFRREVGQFFEGVSDPPTDAELVAIAPGFPVFAVVSASASPGASPR